MTQPYPILEFDPAPESILEPQRLLPPGVLPEHCVLTFFLDVIQQLLDAGKIRPVYTLSSEMGRNPIYLWERPQGPLALFHPGVGAALAGAFLEEAIALGSRKFVACGGCGVLDRSIAVGHLLLPTSAVRDEGMSYHYAPPSREVEADPAVVAVLEQVLQRQQVDYLRVKTWTTDAIYRETRAKAAQRLAEGCLAVEMEAAAFFAIARFRGVRFGQYLYGGDAVIHAGWDSRGWMDRADIRAHLVELSAQAVFEL